MGYRHRQKILEVIQPVDGGSAVHMCQLLDNLDLETFEVHLAAPDNSQYREICQKRGINYQIINFRRSRNPLNDILPFCKLYRLCKQEKYSIVHAHCTKAGLLSRIGARLAGTKVVYTPHGFIYSQPAPRIFQFIYYWLERITLPLVSKVIFVSPSEADVAITDNLLPLPQSQVIVNGVATNIQQRDPDVSPVVVMVSRLDEPKKPEDLIEAIPQILTNHPKSKFIFIGEGSKRSMLEKMIIENNISESVKLLGYRKDISEQLVKSTITVLCSSSEGMPYVVLEAMACSRPVVGSKVKGIIDVVVDGKNGLLYELGNSKDLADKILKLLDNPSLAKEFGQNGRKLVLANYSVKGMVDKIQRLYQEYI